MFAKLFSKITKIVKNTLLRVKRGIGYWKVNLNSRIPNSIQ